ncbi:MAG: outer membrane beta-barrel protein [Alcanivoracaceae bacterium]|jgi:hypothetical protein|nr:outer membrane beta-barrel protein [Alcanivoracaceae bacterium]
MRRFVVAALLSVAATAQAADPHFYAGLGFDVGGDKVLEVDYVGGGSDAIYAGMGFHLAVGMDLDFGTEYMLRGSVGYKGTSISAKNGDATFSRTPLEVIGYRFFGLHGVGLGLTHHRNVQVECDFSGGICPFSKVDLDNATGLLVEYLYRVRREDSNKGFSVGVRLGAIEYKDPGGGDDIGGGFIGANIGITL